jgi:CheY-like chemotaxis protein
VLIEFAVADTGIGMTPDELDRLFRPFVQADGSITRRYGGTGLGLTISRRLAQLMGGGIDTRSTHGVGSCFTLWLPLGTGTRHDSGSGDASGAALDTSARPTLAARAARIAGAHILLVEDDETNRSVITRVLTQAGLRVTAAEHGVAALEKLATSNFDAVLLDLLMPEMDGFETITAIRANAAWAGLPVIAVTAATLIHDADSCLNAGMNDYLAKPVQPLILIDTLLRHVAAHERSSEPLVPANSVEQGQLLDRLSNLQGRPANNDFISVGELSELRDALSSIAGARAVRLEAAISRYDYKEARAVLADLMTSVCAATDL